MLIRSMPISSRKMLDPYHYNSAVSEAHHYFSPNIGATVIQLILEVCHYAQPQQPWAHMQAYVQLRNSVRIDQNSAAIPLSFHSLTYAPYSHFIPVFPNGRLPLSTPAPVLLSIGLGTALHPLSRCARGGSLHDDEGSRRPQQQGRPQRATFG